MYSLLSLDDFKQVFLLLVKMVKGGGGEVKSLAFFLGIEPSVIFWPL